MENIGSKRPKLFVNYKLSKKTFFQVVTGGVYKTKVRFHRNILIYDYL